MFYYMCSHLLRRFEKLIQHQPSMKATIEFIHTLRASPCKQQGAAEWCAWHMIVTLSSIKKPSVNDVKVFVNVAKMEGLAFFSDTCMQAHHFSSCYHDHLLSA